MKFRHMKFRRVLSRGKRVSSLSLSLFLASLPVSLSLGRCLGAALIDASQASVHAGSVAWHPPSFFPSSLSQRERSPGGESAARVPLRIMPNRRVSVRNISPRNLRPSANDRPLPARPSARLRSI